MARPSKQAKQVTQGKSIAGHTEDEVPQGRVVNGLGRSHPPRTHTHHQPERQHTYRLAFPTGAVSNTAANMARPTHGKDIPLPPALTRWCSESMTMFLGSMCAARHPNPLTTMPIAVRISFPMRNLSWTSDLQTPRITQTEAGTLTFTEPATRYSSMGRAKAPQKHILQMPSNY